MLPYDAFRARFTDAEKVRVELAAQHDGALAKTHPSNLLAASLRSLIADAMAAGVVSLSSPRVIGGVEQLAAAGILDGDTLEARFARAAEILAPVADGPAPGATAFGFTVGQAVRVLPPFNVAFAGEHIVEAFTDSAVQIEGGTQFEPQFLEAA